MKIQYELSDTGSCQLSAVVFKGDLCVVCRETEVPEFGAVPLPVQSVPGTVIAVDRLIIILLHMSAFQEGTEFIPLIL